MCIYELARKKNTQAFNAEKISGTVCMGDRVCDGVGDFICGGNFSLG